MVAPLILGLLGGLGGLAFLKSDSAQPSSNSGRSVSSTVRPPNHQYNRDAIGKLKAEIERQKQNRLSRSGMQPGQSSPYTSMDDIMRRLEELQDPSRYLMDENALRSQAGMSVASKYDPLISELRNAQRATQTRGDNYNKRLGEMFSSLSTDLRDNIPAVQQQFADYKTDTQQQYDRLEQNIAGQYAQSQADQEALFKRLNIEAAAADTLPQQMRDRDFFVNNTRQNAQVQQDAIGTEERGNVEFTRRGSELASVEGTERQANLQQQLLEMLAAYDSKIASTEAQKQAEFNSVLSQLQTGGMESARKYAQQDFDNYLSSIRLGRELSKDQGGTVKAVSSPADMAARTLQMGLSPYASQQVQDVFMSSLGDGYIQAQYNTNTGTPASKEALASRILELGRQRGLNQQQLNALYIGALEYFGRQ